MSYVDNSIMPGEQVLFRTRLHPIVFALPVVFALLAVLAHWGIRQGVMNPAGLFGVLAVVLGIVRCIDFVTSEFAVTTKRVIIKVGVVRRRTLEMQLTKVEAVAVEQSIPGRIFGYGNIVVTGTGGTKEPFKRISEPLGFRRAVQHDPA